jgi:hypothetical protein
MSHLFNLQNKFQNYLLYSHEISEVSSEAGLIIYKDSYRSRLHKALSKNYPVLQKYLGYSQFQEYCNNYIDAYPSYNISIRGFGDKLSSFLSIPYLSELAKFEWTCGLVFDAADSEIFQLEAINKIPEEAWIKMRFQPHSSLHCITLSWNVVQIWQDILDDKLSTEPKINATPLNWRIWRKGLESRFSLLSEDEAWAINALLKHSTFGEICQGLYQWFNTDEKVSIRAGVLLRSWIESGLVAKIIF